jgi:hypothetical protein
MTVVVALLDYIGIVALPVGVFGVSAFYPALRSTRPLRCGSAGPPCAGKR